LLLVKQIVYGEKLNIKHKPNITGGKRIRGRGEDGDARLEL